MSKKPFRLIVAGSRTFNDYQMLCQKLDALLARKIDDHEIIIVSGGARGADSLGEKYSFDRGFGLEVYAAEWDLHGKQAGFIRNRKMASVADALAAFWDGVSRGTSHMIEVAKELGLAVRVVHF